MADFDYISFHRMLINDQPRTRAYREAILKTVRKGDVVVDIGGGSGVLTLFACQAGARKVYCIERTDIIHVSKKLAEANGYADRIVFLNEDAMAVDLDEQLDVIVSEQIGKAGIGDNMGPLVARFRDRYLKAGGRILPETMEIFVAPVDARGIDRSPWPPAANRYGLDFSPLAQFTDNRPMSARIRAEALLADGQSVFSYIAPVAPPVDAIHARVTFTGLKKGRIGGFCSWFTSTLAPGIDIDNRPPGTLNWDNYVYPLPHPIEVGEDTVVELSFRAGSAGEMIPVSWIWDTTILEQGRPVAEFRQSSSMADFFFEPWFMSMRR